MSFWQHDFGKSLCFVTKFSGLNASVLSLWELDFLATAANRPQFAQLAPECLFHSFLMRVCSFIDPTLIRAAPRAAEVGSHIRVQSFSAAIFQLH